MSRASKKRTAILISGRGSNMGALIAAASDPAYPAEIAGVISSRADAKGLETAPRLGIATRIVARRDFADDDGHEAAMAAAMAEMEVEIVCLAGYMRLLPPGLVDRWQGRMLNIHPSLLPSFRGLQPHAQALAAGVRIHGCTVHFVTQEVDAGPILAQAAVPVIASEDEEQLAKRVLAAEHRLYPLALAMVADGRARMEGGRTVFAGAEAREGGALFAPEFGVASDGTSDLEALARFTP